MNPLTPHLDHPFLILIWHILVGYLLTVSCDWNWIPLTKGKKEVLLDQIRGKIFWLTQLKKNCNLIER